MAELDVLHPNYLDWAKRLDPDGNIATIAEILSAETPILEDMVVVEANGAVSHRTTVRSGLPAGAWRRLNYGVPVEKGKTKQITDVIGSLETYGEVDKDLAMLNGNSAAWRLSEESGFIEGLAQTMSTTVLYGNTDSDPEKFLGLTYRYDDPTADNGRMVIDGGAGSSSGADQTSIWGVVWGAKSCHMTFPNGSTAGLHFEDLGQVTLDDDATPVGHYEGFRTHYQWKAGMVVRDWRQVVRICNLDNSVTNLTSGKILDLMVDAMNQIHRPGAGRMVWYANRTVKAVLDKEALNKDNMALAQQQQDNGGPVTMFWGTPIKHLESLVNTEALITGF